MVSADIFVILQAIVDSGPSRFIRRSRKRAQNITVIPAKRTVGTQKRVAKVQKIRVAAYCRVSTEFEEQESSYDVQVEHYTTYIQSNPEWELVEVYADDGITGTNTKKRD